MAEVNPKPGKIDDKTGFRTFSDKEAADAADKAAKTEAGSHRATARGYAGGEVIEPGRLVPAGAPVSDDWMEPVGGKKASASEARLARAIEEAQDPQPGDVDLTGLSKPALEAEALRHGINAKGLSKDDLISAIKAANDKDRTV